LSSDSDSGVRPAHHEPHDGPAPGRDPIDVHIGGRIRLRRSGLAMPPEQLAAAMGVTRRQIEHFESGSRPVPSARLWDLAEILDVPLEYFFEED